MRYTFEQAKEIINSRGYTILQDEPEHFNCKSILECMDSEGYYVFVTLDKIINRPNQAFRRFHTGNPRTIDNINIFAEKNNIKTRCISTEYIDINTPLQFCCECGNVFSTSLDNFKWFHKVKCDKCTGYNAHKTFIDIKDDLQRKGYNLIIDEKNYKGITLTDLICTDKLGYKYSIKYNAVMSGKKPETFHPCNPFTLYNINLFLELQQLPFECISQTFEYACNDLEFKCKRCGEIVKQRWQYIYKKGIRNGKQAVGILNCPYCDGRIESVHALVLKQMFLHNYPDTIVEDKTYRNPLTNKIAPTDIVNHRLKIAVEIQSQWHDSPDAQIKDKLKKEFWVNSGYKFYALDIRDYTILKMCQVFFGVTELPDYINFEYSNKLNLKEAQQNLDNGLSVLETADVMGVDAHRIYDALGCNKLHYPDNYIPTCWSPVVQFDLYGNYLNEYISISKASEETKIPSGNISSCLLDNRHFCGNYLWYYKCDVDKIGIDNIEPSKYIKFYQPVDKYDLNGNHIQSFANMYDAAKDIGDISYKIWRVTEGIRKSIKGFTYKYSNKNIIVENA